MLESPTYKLWDVITERKIKSSRISQLLCSYYNLKQLFNYLIDFLSSRESFTGHQFLISSLRKSFEKKLFNLAEKKLSFLLLFF